MAITLAQMREFLSRSYSDRNRNKINGVLAEADFYRHVERLGQKDRVSVGGWVMRPKRTGRFGEDAIAVFPEEVPIGVDLPVGRPAPSAPTSVDAAAGFLLNARVDTYFCYPCEGEDGIVWKGLRRGVPAPSEPRDVRELVAEKFVERERHYNFLRYSCDVSNLDDPTVRGAFSLESLRVYIESRFFSETSDVDRLIWGRNVIYPVEVKEKTRVTGDTNIGDWFGLDAGPFAKLAYFAAWHGNMRSLFIVREISDTATRQAIQWWAIEFSELAKRASWVPQSGGPNMRGGQSSVLKIPVDAFSPLDRAFFEAL